MATFLEIQTRFAELIGETDTTNLTVPHLGHINAFIKDITNSHPFSWNVKTSDLTLSSGTANLPTDYNPKWQLLDARIVNSSTGDDNIFTHVPIDQRDRYASGDYVYWITYDTSGERYVFNTQTQSGTVKIYNNFIPADLSADGDVSVVWDTEAVAYGAAAKNWIGDERNVELKREYSREAEARVQAMYIQDINFGPEEIQASVVEMNADLLTDNSSNFNTLG